MKINRLFYIAAIFLLAACGPQEAIVEFGVDTDSFELGPEGGVQKVNVSSAENWTAIVQEPWITVSPANGNSSQECRIIVDSALTFKPRVGTVRITNLDTDEHKDFTITQKGFDYTISLKDQTVEIDSYADLADRSFDVVVNSNVPFDIKVDYEESENPGKYPTRKDWLKYSVSELDLDRGARPRNARIHFEWKINTFASPSKAKISFVPVADGGQTITPTRNDVLSIVQGSATPIPENTVEGDSLAILAINRALNCWQEWDTTEKMEYWDNVEVWKSGENKGRIKSVRFFLFATKEGIPFEVQYLTAAEEVEFYSNGNSFMYSLDPGEYITKLTQLRKLTIGAYGLTDLPESFKNLKNLEYLDLSSNNFQKFPDILTPENFPNLTALILNANQRRMIYDLSNTTYEDYGGFVDECVEVEPGKRVFPEWLLKWDKLDTLRLSVNYLQGEIPDMKDYPIKWTAEEVHACDTLPEILIGLPKILPETDFFAINLNRLSGRIPDWLLYHPKLDLWYPFSLVFIQEGKDMYGNTAGFKNEPVSMDYYYDHYKNKKYNPDNINK